MRTAVVSGANGFIGHALVRELLEHGYKVYALGRKDRSPNLPQNELMTFVPCALDELESLPQKLPKKQYDIFFHLAWEGSAGPKRGDISLQLKNAQWTIDVLHAAKKLGCGRIVCAGSIMEREAICSVYAKETLSGFGGIYGAGKIAAHIMSLPVAAQLGQELIWGEITNAYGPGEKSTRLISTTIQKCLRGEPPRFTSGTQNYDFVYIDDVARAFRLIGEKGKPFREYLIGSSAARPLKEFLLEMQSAIAPELPFLFGEMPFAGVNLPISQFDCSQTQQDTGFHTRVGFAEGCRRTYAWWKEEKERGRFLESEV